MAEPVLSEASVASTTSECAPRPSPLSSSGDAQSATASPSRVQANVAASFAEKVSVALVSSVSAGGPVRVTVGAVRSTTFHE